MQSRFCRKRYVAALLCISLISFKAGAQQSQLKKVHEAALPLDPAVRTGKLANGFTYYIRHNEEPKNRVIIYLANKAGSVLEDEDQRGLAHFTEHMSFNGTKHFPHNQLVDYLQKAGVRFGADINAYTSFDETVYELPLPSDQPKLLTGGLEIMRDWAHEALLDPAEIDKERGVVLEEERLGKGAGERIRRQVLPVILNNSRYAVRLPIGLDTVLHNFKRPAIARFYNDWYRPDLQALIVVGDINADKIEAAVKQQFSNLKNPAHERVRTKYNVPLTGKNQFIALTDKEQTGLTAQLIYKMPGLEERTAADYRQQIVRGLFNQMLSARLAELSRKAEPPFLQGSAGFGGLLGGLDQYSLSVTAKPGALEQGLKAVLRENERVKRFGFTQTELDRVKLSLLNSMETALKEQGKTTSASYVSEYLANFLKGSAAPGIASEYELVKNDLPGIQLSELNNLAKAVTTTTNRDIIILAPDAVKGSLPDEARVLDWISNVEREVLSPYRDDVSSKPLLPAQPEGGRVLSAVKDERLGTTLLTLSNGVKILLKPTKFKNDEIQFIGFAPGGTSLASDADFQSAANAINIIPSFGVGNYTPTQLTKYLSGKQVSVRPYISERSQGISGGATKKDLEAALQLVYAFYTQPRRDDTLFAGIINRSKASLLNRGNDPGSVFQDSVSAILGNHNLRRTGPSLTKLAEIDLDKSYQFYKERFAHASDLNFTFVGSFDSDSIQPLLALYLGALPAGKPEEAKDLGIHIPDGIIEGNIYKGSEPRATVQLYWSGAFAYNATEKIRMDALKECLEIRLLERLREDESGVYSPAVSVSTNKYPQARYTLVVSFGCAPQNVDKLVASALDEIGKLKTAGPPQVNIDKWRAETLRGRETALQTNGFWLNYLTGQQQNQADLHEYEVYTDEIQKINPAAVKIVANKYLTGENYIRLVLLPEKYAVIKAAN